MVSKMKGTVIQLGSSMILALLTFKSGFANVWPSYAMPMLQSEESPLGYPISELQANVISSIPMLASIISTLLTGSISEALGRKRTQLLCALIYLTSWTLITTARSAIQIIIARFIIGLSGGMALVSVVVYVSEITELSNRGSGATVVSLLTNMGMMMSYLEGWFFGYYLICYLSISGTLVFVILMVCLKESPPWLVKCGRDKEALVALKFYRGKSETTQAILEELSYLKSQANTKQENTGKSTWEIDHSREHLEDTDNTSPWKQLVMVDYNRRALMTSVTFMVFAVLTGMVAVQTYAIQFFSKAIPSISPNLSSVVLAFVLILTSCVTILVTDLVTRRALMISTASTSSVCLIFLGSAMRWPDQMPIWVAPLAVIIYCISYQLGLINIVFIQISESFGPKIISAATAVVICVMFATNFFLLFSFAPAVEYFGIDVIFFVFASLGAIMTILAYFFLKETRWVKIEDVQKMFSKGFQCTRL